MKRIFILTMFLFLAISCTDRVNFFGPSNRNYNKTLNSWTQQKRFYTLENVQYHTSITYKSEEFRRAYVAEYAEMYRLSPEKTDEMLKKELSEAKDYDVFVVSHFSSQKDASKITASPKIWGISLSTSGAKESGEEPKSVSSLPSADDPVFSHFFPYVSPWASNYLVMFKKVEAPDGVYVRLTGVLADLTFTWKNRS